MIPSIDNDNAWDSWIEIDKISLKDGDIFILGCHGKHSDGIYKLDPGHPSFSTSRNLSKWCKEEGDWDNNHAWDINSPGSYVRLLKKIEIKVSAIPSQSGYVCKLCNSLNIWAGPNQKDGSYICFECR